MYNTVNKPEARAVFDLFDKDNNGALSRAEFITMMRQWGLSQSAAEPEPKSSQRTPIYPRSKPRGRVHAAVQGAA